MGEERGRKGEEKGRKGAGEHLSKYQKQKRNLSRDNVASAKT